MRIKLSAALARWQEAGLLDAATAAAIQEHERATRNPLLANAAYLLGAFAVLLGIVALVAANWNAIPATLKLAVHLALNIAVAAALFLAHATGRSTPREALALISFGLVLTLIALIGQIYQLQSPLWVALGWWMVLASPLVMVFARSLFVLLVWLVALTVTLATTWLPVHDMLTGQEALAPHAPAIMVAAYGALPLLFVALGGLGHPEREESRFARLFIAYGLAGLIFAASWAQFIWYAGSDGMDGTLGESVSRLVACVWLAVLAAAVLALMRGRLRPAAFRALAVLTAVCIALASLPFVWIAPESRPVGAGLFIVVWAVVAWAGVTAGWVWAARLAVAAIVIRLLAIYFELFGTLMQTGLGLVISGLVVIALTFLGVRVQRRLAAMEPPP